MKGWFGGETTYVTFFFSNLAIRFRAAGGTCVRRLMRDSNLSRSVLKLVRIWQFGFLREESLRYRMNNQTTTLVPNQSFVIRCHLILSFDGWCLILLCHSSMGLHIVDHRRAPLEAAGVPHYSSSETQIDFRTKLNSRWIWDTTRHALL